LCKLKNYFVLKITEQFNFKINKCQEKVTFKKKKKFNHQTISHFKLLMQKRSSRKSNIYHKQQQRKQKISEKIKVPDEIYKQENSQFIQFLLMDFFRIEFLPKIEIESISTIKRLCKCSKFVIESEENKLLQNQFVFRRLADKKRLDILLKLAPWDLEKMNINAKFLLEVAYVCVQHKSNDSLPLLKYIVSLETQIPYWKVLLLSLLFLFFFFIYLFFFFQFKNSWKMKLLIWLVCIQMFQ